MRVVRKSVAYLTWSGRILFFRAVEAPASGAELPGGTLEPGEDPHTGVYREVAEETGLEDLGPAELLGVVDHDPPAQPGEIHRRHFYHIPLRSGPPDRWTRVVEEGNGTFTFDFFWARPSEIPVDVHPGHDAFVDEVRSRIS